MLGFMQRGEVLNKKVLLKLGTNTREIRASIVDSQKCDKLNEIVPSKW